MSVDRVGFGGLVYSWIIMAVVFVPLGLWKFIDIVVWIVRNVRITIG